MKKSLDIPTAAKSVNKEKRKLQMMYSKPNSIIPWTIPGNQYQIFSRIIKRCNS